MGQRNLTPCVPLHFDSGSFPFSVSGCCGLNCVPQPPTFLCWNPNSRPLPPPGQSTTQNVTVFGDGAFKEVIKVKWGHTGLVRGDTRDEHRGWTLWGHSEKAAVCTPRREAPGEAKPADTLILDFQSPECWGNNFCCFKSPSAWYFVMAAQAD